MSNIERVGKVRKELDSAVVNAVHNRKRLDKYDGHIFDEDMMRRLAKEVHSKIIEKDIDRHKRMRTALGQYYNF